MKTNRLGRAAEPSRRAAARVRALWRSRAGSWLPAVALAALGLFEVHDAARVGPVSWLGAAVLLATLPLAWRRRHPVGAASLMVAGSVLANLAYQAGFPYLPGSEAIPGGIDEVGGLAGTLAHIQLVLPSLTILLAVYLLVRHGTARSRWLMAVTVVALWAAPLVPEGTAETALLIALGGLVAAAAGDAGRTRSQLQQERAASMARVIAAERRQAVMTERARIARELHDVVAHSVSVIAVRAELSPYSIPGLPPGAQEGFQDIARSARSAMGELRQLLDVLRGDSAAELAPQPSLDRLEELLRQHREAGGSVELHVHGSRRPLGVPVELSAYRIVQEALTNTRKHAAGAHARVEIGYHPDQLTVRVTDDGPGPTERAGAAGRFDVGHGLLGMRERASILGGELTAGPGPAGGFEVAAELPLSAEEPTSS